MTDIFAHLFFATIEAVVVIVYKSEVTYTVNNYRIIYKGKLLVNRLENFVYR